MRRVICIIVVFCLFAISGCGYREGITQKSELSYIRLTGNPSGVTVVIDDLQPFTVTEGDKVYQLAPGKHIIKVFRGGNPVVHRIIILDSGVTTEVQVP